ncbi:MAG: tetratricopeptide repeat protein, partial [Bacteroidales bacterium]|nr:tetratricopeptide repeat protein [Bacteroidales bacterium]
SFLLPYKNLKRIQPPAPEYAYALAKIAESYIREKSVDTASSMPLIREAIKIDPKNPEIYLIAGDIYIAANDGSNAIKNYNMAQYYNPNSPTANMKIGDIYVRGKNLNVAIPYFEEAIKLDPNYAPAYRELAQLYSLAGRHAQSKENYQKYLDLNAGNIPAQTRYVTSLFYAGDYEEVIKNIEEIFAVDKSRAYLNRLAGYSSYELASKSKNGNYDQAKKYMDELFKSMPKDRILWKDHHYMARILVRKNHDYPVLTDELASLENQLENQKRSLSLASTSAAKSKIQPVVDELTTKVEAMKADVAEAEKELDRAFTEYQKVSELRPQDKAVLSEMAANYYNFRRYDNAARTWAKLIDPADENPDSYMQVGRAFYNGKNYKSADSLFNVILKKSPKYIPAHLWIARTATKTDPDNKTRQARDKFINLIKVSQSDSLKNKAEITEAFNFLCYYYMNKDELAEARNIYNRWLNLDPDDKDGKIRAYHGLGAIELIAASGQPSIE